MTQQELIELVKLVQFRQAEMQTVEVKAAHLGCPKRLYDTLSSFSNQDKGGILLFGLDEKQSFRAVGVYDLQDLQKQVTEQCNQMEPPVRAVFTIAEYEAVSVCCAEIPAVDLSERPCYYKGKGRLTGAYVRVGDADLPMTEYELYSYEAFRKHLHDDERRSEWAVLDELNQNALQQYLINRRSERPGFAQLSLERAYELLNITRNGVPTLAAVLNFGLYPQGYYPQLAITAVAVDGTEIGEKASNQARFVDNRRIEGTLSEMVEGAVAFCHRNMRVATILDSQTMKRNDQTEYPLEAIREAILNAVIHRDYSIYTEGTPVQLDMFRDRLEIHSPGSLYGRMTVEDLGYARPDLRNPALAVMTELLTGAENRYSGIPTIRRAMKEYGLPEPVFENRRNEFVVTLYNVRTTTEAVEQENENAYDKDILRFCQSPRSRQEIKDFFGVKTWAYVKKNHIDPLLQVGSLAMTIPESPKSSHQRFYTVS